MILPYFHLICGNKMETLNLIHFIINKLITISELYEYMIWFETIKDKSIKYNKMDNQYTIITTITILEYLKENVTQYPFKFLHKLEFTDPYLENFLTFDIDRENQIIVINEDFYNLFINEASCYLSGNNLK